MTVSFLTFHRYNVPTISLRRQAVEDYFTHTRNQISSQHKLVTYCFYVSATILQNWAWQPLFEYGQRTSHREWCVVDTGAIFRIIHPSLTLHIRPTYRATDQSINQSSYISATDALPDSLTAKACVGDVTPRNCRYTQGNHLFTSNFN
jgi:hypothetical protein